MKRFPYRIDASILAIGEWNHRQLNDLIGRWIKPCCLGIHEKAPPYDSPVGRHFLGVRLQPPYNTMVFACLQPKRERLKLRET
ncbi:hypothetical protein D3C86_1873210 [compost metagenome]